MSYVPPYCYECEEEVKKNESERCEQCGSCNVTKT